CQVPSSEFQVLRHDSKIGCSELGTRNSELGTRNSELGTRNLESASSLRRKLRLTSRAFARRATCALRDCRRLFRRWCDLPLETQCISPALSFSPALWRSRGCHRASPRRPSRREKSTAGFF